MNMFEYVIQFGAILAVILLYFNKLNPFSKPTVQAQKDTWQLWAKVIIAVLPSVVVGLPLNDWMDKHLHTPLVVATTLILYGVLFIVLENYLKNKHAHITSCDGVLFLLSYSDHGWRFNFKNWQVFVARQWLYRRAMGCVTNRLSRVLLSRHRCYQMAA